MTTALEERFAATIGELDLPDADLVTAVLRVVDEPAARLRRPRLAIAVTVAAILVSLTLAIEPAREAVADFLGIGTTRVEIIPDDQLSADLPSNADTAEGGTSAVPTSNPAATETTSTGQVSPSVEVDPIPELGPPVGGSDFGVARGRRYTWPAGPEFPALGQTDIGLILSVREAEGPLDVKRVASDAELVMVSIDFAGVATVGLWIGSDHELVAAGTEGPVLSEQVLLWEADGIQYRLEGDLTQIEMQELAQAVEGGTDLLRPG